MGPGTKYFGRTRVSRGCLRIEVKLIPSRSRESELLRSIQRVTGSRFGAGISLRTVGRASYFIGIGGYSAAAANESFGFAADIMKSEIRGTISDLKREPLKTP
jgi:hypothetical protein